ncbi:N-acetyl-gamma-glutamyl-phosphate reductase [Clostridium sp. DJ247]|uniref:N-acetyl-gamma-glutamyl-phosphate reductase n=1 Tax=Clostridium sp. DJ247 TaxID=2726188 RepID=UPI001624C426|nr:N-acetyl-gamma-glutamyl-phosphate reductase [Clostridium sp. DJ247]MBC2580373.1 N-acetyl-gamma-glutamyl-phosphate reductase [Clostridium sp. DJ247]
MINIGIIGSTGYAGQQLVWILNNHPSAYIKFLCTHSFENMEYREIYKNYEGFIDNICINIQEAENQFKDIDVLFICLPHGKSFDIAKKALDLGVKVIDLGADFRLKSKETYKEWYKLEHQCSELLNEAVYGLPELHREKVKEACLIANPGCYTTASILALAPLLNAKIINPKSIIIDAKSGVSGAGRSANIANLFAECNESIKAYSVAAHRHTPEIEQELSNVYGEDIILTFTPHLIPMNKGILSMCYAELTSNVSEEDIYEIFNNFYKDEFFVKITEYMPETKWVKGSNMCHIGLRVDKRTNRVIVGSAIDNLMKGAAGQAVQNMNIIFGLDEKTGLNFPAMMP